MLIGVASSGKICIIAVSASICHHQIRNDLMTALQKRCYAAPDYFRDSPVTHVSPAVTGTVGLTVDRDLATARHPPIDLALDCSSHDVAGTGDLKVRVARDGAVV